MPLSLTETFGPVNGARSTGTMDVAAARALTSLVGAVTSPGGQRNRRALELLDDAGIDSTAGREAANPVRSPSRHRWRIST
jgi:hypothetical protein